MTNEIEKLIQEWSNVILTQDPKDRDRQSNWARETPKQNAPSKTRDDEPVIDLDKELGGFQPVAELPKSDVAPGPSPLSDTQTVGESPQKRPKPSHANNIDPLAGNSGLSQQEIDAILGVGVEDNSADTGFGVLTDTRNIGKNRLVLLDVLYGRLIRRASNSLRKFSSDSVDISLEHTELVRFGSYLNSVFLPAMIGVFRAEEWDNYGLISLNSDLIYAIIEVLLGGQQSRGQLNRSRSFSQLDSTLVEKFISTILDDLIAAFDPIFPVTLRLERIETNPRFAEFTSGTNLSHLGRFQVEFGNRRGNMDILFPLSTLEPVKEILTQSFMGEKFGRDPVWEKHFRASLNHTFVNLDSLLTDMYLPLSSLQSWHVGKIIPLGISPDSLITLSCNGRDLFKGVIGQSDGKIAVQIKQQISHSSRSTAPVLV